MASITCLHLTDLHIGMGAQRTLLQQFRQNFFDDLEQLHRSIRAPIDIVCFTGDLVQKGDRSEFNKLGEFLDALWDVLRQFGPDPLLLAVPGNHDLVRPSADPAHRRSRHAELQALANWQAQPDLQDAFWQKKTSPYRRLVDRAFANYSAWWASDKRPPSEGLSHGILPGDFSYSFEKDDISLGIVGLNTTFLQLSGGDFSRKLAVSSLQFQQACGGDGPSWTRNHDACILLTHQPESWLNADAASELRSQILVPGRFVAHMFGHMHVPEYEVSAFGGSLPVRKSQGRSLFGLEYLDASKRLERTHGYAVVQLDFQACEVVFTLWPRALHRLQSGAWKIIPDPTFDLVNNQHTGPERFPRSGTNPRRSTVPHENHGEPEPVERVWDSSLPPPREMVVRQAEKDHLLGLLRDPTVRQVTLIGPAGSGKTVLAVAAAHETRSIFMHGAGYVRFSPLDPTGSAAAPEPPQLLANHLSRPLMVSNTLPAILALLRNKQMLLLLDSFESALAAAGALADLLESCPQVKVLVCSHQALSPNCPPMRKWEHPLYLRPLSVPPEQAAFTDVAVSPAVRLFLESARRSASGFELSEQNAAEIVDLCQRSQGNALAIALTASRPAPLAATGESGDVDSTVAKAYEELTAEERAVFRAAVLFPGSFTMEAIASVSGVTECEAPLTALVQRQILQRLELSTECRYVMHDKLRDFGAALLRKEVA